MSAPAPLAATVRAVVASPTRGVARYSSVTNRALDDARTGALTSRDLELLAAYDRLAAGTGKVAASVPRMARALSVSESTIRRANKRLGAAEHITRVPQYVWVARQKVRRQTASLVLLIGAARRWAADAKKARAARAQAAARERAEEKPRSEWAVTDDTPSASLEVRRGEPPENQAPTSSYLEARAALRARQTELFGPSGSPSGSLRSPRTPR